MKNLTMKFTLDMPMTSQNTVVNFGLVCQISCTLTTNSNLTLARVSILLHLTLNEQTEEKVDCYWWSTETKFLVSDETDWLAI